MSIINAFPTTLVNGAVADATVVMTLLAWIQSQTNGNACPATVGTTLQKANGTGGLTSASPGIDYLAAAPGMIFDFAGSVTPGGYLLCDGSAVSRTGQSALFAAIGTTWGVGDGSTTFNLPDLRGRTAIGAGTGSGLTNRTLGTQNLGEEAHVLVTGELATHGHSVSLNDAGHTHGITDPGHVHTYQGPTSAQLQGGGAQITARYGSGDPLNSGQVNSVTTGVTVNATTTGITVNQSNAGSNTAHNTMQPSAVVNKIIKT